MKANSPTPTRRHFLWLTAAAAAAAGLPLRAGQDEDILRGTDPDVYGPYRLGKEIYRNPLRSAGDVQGWRLEGQAKVSFPRGRLRLENLLDPSLGQKSNFVYWLPKRLPGSFAASWKFWPVKEPGLCMVFFAAGGRKGEDLFDPALARRAGEYQQYHHGDINALHLSYFRRGKPGEREFHVCNLRKSYGFNLVAEGADPIPNVSDAGSPYEILLIKRGPEVAFFINHLPVLTWVDNGLRYGPPLGPGYVGLRQMAPLVGEYGDFVVREVTRGLPPSAGFRLRRLTEHPIITPAMLPDDPVVNLNGPSLIRVPAWLPNPLGKYYLYFGNHRGPEVHLAYADRLEGPWRIHRPGPVSVYDVARVNGEMPDAHKHAASPDVYIDDERREVRLYFHFRLPKLGHVSTLARSPDGLRFTVQPGTIGGPYLRHFRYGGAFYFIDRDGRILRSPDGLSGFETGPDAVRAPTANRVSEAELRHTGVRRRGDTLEIFLTRVGDAPESILYSSMRLTGDWRSWRAGPPLLVLSPETADEGANLAIEPSEKGDADEPENQLRDPFVFDEEGRSYLLYAVAGERGIAIAELLSPASPRPARWSALSPTR